MHNAVQWFDQKVHVEHGFYFDVLPLRHLLNSSSGISYHCYADDMQLYFSVKPNNLTTLHDSLASVTNWMSQNYLKMDQTEVTVIGPDFCTKRRSVFILAPLLTTSLNESWYSF